MFDTMNSPNRNIAIVRPVRDQGGTPTNVSLLSITVAAAFTGPAVAAELTRLIRAYGPSIHADTARDYQKAYWKHGDPPLPPE